MHRWRSRNLLRSGIGLLVGLSFGCGGDDGLAPPIPVGLTLNTGTVALSALGQTRQLTATVTDQRGDPIDDPSIAWSSSDEGVVTVSPTGLVTARGPGTAEITATAADASASAAASVVQTIAAIEPVSGNTQAGVAGRPLAEPLVVGVEDASGQPIAGVPVHFVVAQGGGQVEPADAVTGPDGHASAGYTLGDTPGSAQRVTVTATGTDITATFSATATTVPAAMSLVAGTGQSARSGVAVPIRPAVRVVDAADQPVQGVVVRFQVGQGGGAVTGPLQPTDANGVATVGGWALGPAGVNTLEAAVAFDVLAGEPGIFVATTTPAAGFDISIRYIGSPPSDQLLAFAEAEIRWEQIITGDLADVPINAAAGDCGTDSPPLSDTIDDLVIFASLDPIDGPLGILGRAGPCFIRNSDRLTVVGRMQFDIDDLDVLGQNGAFADVVLHEMGHVLGIGSLWEDKGLLADAVGDGGTDPHFTGAGAVAAFDAAGGNTYTGGAKVPVENTGDVGTVDSHWRETVLGSELMTGFIAFGANPLSAVTVRSLQDEGYTVDISRADPFSLSSALRLPGGPPPLSMNNDVLRLPVRRVDASGTVMGRSAP